MVTPIGKQVGNAGGGSSSGGASASGTAGMGVAGLQAVGSNILVQSFAPEMATAATNPTTAQARFLAVYIPTAMTITGVAVMLSGPVASGISSNNKVGLYTGSAASGLTRVAVSNDTSTLWTQTAGIVGTNFITPYIAAPGLYWAAFCFTGSVVPTIGARTTPYNSIAVQPVGLAGTNVKLSCFITDSGGAGVADLPSGTTAWSALTVTTSIPYIALY